MSSYNKYYIKENYFGNPYPELINYFDKFERSHTILDLGCGQGRDVIKLGQMGFKVKGFDISQVGINQLNKIALNEGLDVIGEVRNYKEYSDFHEYDFIVMNSMFHFYKKDIEDETKDINRILSMMKNGSRLLLVVQESAFRINYIKELLKRHKDVFVIDYEESILYKEFNAKFYMISILKC